MRLRARHVTGAVVLAAGTAALLLASGGSSSELQGELGLRADPRVTVRLGGQLYADRSLRDAEGAPDLAVVTRDEPLTVAVSADDARHVARIVARVDGRSIDTVVPTCGGSLCAVPLRVAIPPLRIVARGVGEHRVSVSVWSQTPAGTSVSRVSFDVNVAARPPATAEAGPATARPRRSAGGDTLAPTARERALRVVAGVSGRPLFIPAPRLQVHAVGDQPARDGARVVTVLVALRPSLRNVHAEIPQVGPPAGGRTARLVAPMLRDLLVDVDVRRRAVVGIEPGPDSTTRSWTPLVAGRPVAAAMTDGDGPSVTAAPVRPRRPPGFARLSDRGPAFLTYDGGADFAASTRDWPVTLIFHGRATIAKVKAGLRRIGLTRRGESRFLGYRGKGAGIRFDGDRGLKSACDRQSADLHVRLYAPTATGRFRDPAWGSFVVGTAHIDRADGCGTPPRLFGLSELAERRLGVRIASRLGWRVRPDRLALGNAEPLRRDPRNLEHIWLGNGLATTIAVP